VQTEEWVDEILPKAEKKMRAMMERNRGKIPYIAVDGVYDDMAKDKIFWWTNGFYAGELWQFYYLTGDDSFREDAVSIEEMLDKAFADFQGLHHDVGFMWMLTSVADYKTTKDERSKVRALHAAALLAGRFNLRGEFLRSWNRDNSGWVIIDSMMNIPILYWASETVKDPRFSQIANAHADSVLEYLVRKDGSVGHIACFDPNTGEFQKLLAGQGYSADSSWSRGQAWAIYGFALAYRHTQKSEYLMAAKNIANYFIACVSRTDFLPLVDFRAPAYPKKWDMSAGTCAACGLMEIADHVDSCEKNLYRDSAVKMLRAIEHAYADWNPDTDGIIGYSSHSYHNSEETHVSMIYGDYFFIEALLRLKGDVLTIW